MLYGYGQKNIFTLQKNICYGNNYNMCTFGLLYHS